MDNLLAAIPGFTADMSGNVQVEKANDLAASAGCQNAVIGFIPLKPPFAGLDDLDSSPAMQADSGSWFERLVKPFVTALKARRRTFSGKASIMVKAMLKGPFFLSLRDWRKTLAQGVNTLLKFRSRFHVRKGWLVRLSRRVPAVWPVSFS